MGTFKDIIDTIGGLEGDIASMVAGGKRFKSLSKASMDGTMNFPVIVSNALSIEDASLVSKALERQFASFTLTLMTMNPYLYTMGGRASASNYINKFHQNLDTRTDGVDLINAVNNFMTEAYAKYGANYDVLEEVSNRIISCVYEGVNSAGVNAENAKYSYTIEEVTESRVLNNFANFSVLYEARGGRRPIQNTSYDDYNFYDMSNRSQTDSSIHDNTFRDNKIDSVKVGDVSNTFGDINVEIRGGRGNLGGGSMDRRQFNHMDVSSDYKKANELVPTLLHMRIYPVDSRTRTELPPIDFVLGIKATLHPVTSEEMIVNIARGIKNEDKFFNFIRWTTGEISFFKDFVLSLNEIKIDAINTSSKASRWWTVLKRRRGAARIKNAVSSNRLLPNATIVITQEEADILRDQYGYNLEKPTIAYKLIENYFLISFVIVDPALQRVKFLFDGKNEFEVMTFAGLARENTVDDRKFKDMMNMLGRRI